MFSNISWTSYLLFVALILVAWYLFVGCKFYFSELQALVSGKVSFFQRKTALVEGSAAIEKSIGSAAERNGPTAIEVPAKEMELLSSRLIESIADAANRGYVRAEFLFLLQLTVKPFPSFKDSPLRSSIDELVQIECDKRGILPLSSEELQQLWIETA